MSVFLACAVWISLFKTVDSARLKMKNANFQTY